VAAVLGQVTFIANVNLHPLNTYTKMPAYDIYVSSGAHFGADGLGRRRSRRDPIYAMGRRGPRWSACGSKFALAARKLDAARAPELIVTNENADVVWRGRIDLSRYR
jgi:hypothetical protein